MGQQVGNCKHFTLTHNLAYLFAMDRDPRSITLCTQHHFPLTYLSFQVCRSSHSWDTAISIFYLENPRSMLSVRSDFKVTTWVRHPIDSNPVFRVNIALPFPWHRFFQNFTWKIEGQGHNWRSHSRYNTLSTHIPFVQCRWPSHSHIQVFKNLTLKIQGQGQRVNVESHNMGPTFHRLTWLSFHVDRPSHSRDKTIQNLTVKIEGQATVQGYKVDIKPYRLISLSLHADRPSHSWDTDISKFDVENSRSRSCVRSTLKVTTWVQHSIDTHPISSMLIGPPIPEIQHFQNCILKLHGQCQMTIMLHNHRSRQFLKISNCINPSSGFRDMGSAKPGPSAAWFDKFLANEQAHMGQWANNYNVAQLQL